MHAGDIKDALFQTYGNLSRNHTLQMAAALSYYFVMSLFPALIFLSAVVSYLPAADLFDRTLNLMGRLVPADGMTLVRTVLADVVTPNRGTLLSLGLLATFWTASGGFAAAIEALNMAYAVDCTWDHGRGAALWRLGGPSHPSVSDMVVNLARAALDSFDRLHDSCSGSALFSGSQCPATFYFHATRRNPGGRLLAGALLFVGSLFPQFCQFQQDLWNAWRGYRSHGLAVLDGIRYAAGSGT